MARAQLNKRKASRRKSGKRQAGGRRSLLVYLLAALALAVIIGWAWNWWTMRDFRPNSQVYTEQGVFVGEDDGEIRFETARAIGAQFAYVQASGGGRAKDERFAQNLKGAKQAGLQVGAVHLFDPCLPADPQSANFVTMVPRDASLLPPAIALEETASICLERVQDAAVESELMILINQIEMHSGKPVLLKLSSKFQRKYAISARIDRDLWLSRDRFTPDYAGRPWLMWSANDQLESEAAASPIEWVVVQP